MVALIGSPLRPGERVAVAFFGIRGVGSVYYLAYALQEESFEGAEALWALVALVILISAVVHGAAVSPVMRRVEKTSEERERVEAMLPDGPDEAERATLP